MRKTKKDFLLVPLLESRSLSSWRFSNCTYKHLVPQSSMGSLNTFPHILRRTFVQLEDVYGQVFKVLKPGASFVTYE